MTITAAETRDAGISTPAPTHKIEELESLRGLAALLIVAYHIPFVNLMLRIGIRRNGYLMVDLFFVLSGFVMLNAYGEKLRSWRDLARFQFLRLGRLYPVHLLFVLVFVAIEAAKYFAQAKLGIASQNSQPFRENGVTALAQQLFLVQSIGPWGHPLTFNEPAWSTSVEFYTYAVFGGLVLWFGRFRVQVFALMAAISLALLPFSSPTGYESLLRCFAGFFLGSLTASAVAHWKAKGKFPLPGWVSLAVLAGTIAFLQMKPPRRFDMPIYFFTAALIAALVLAPEGLLNRALRWKPLTWLGTVSYSVYMSHLAVLWVITQFYRVVLKYPVMIVEGKSYPPLPDQALAVACAVILVSVLAVGALVYRFVEKPLRERSRQFAFRRLG